MLTLVGTALGAGFLLVHEVALTEFFQRPWQRIGVRILGSWVGTISIMVLALSVAPCAADRIP
jgi:urease accessory protein